MPRPPRRSHLLAASLVVACLALSACSDDGSDGAGEDDGTEQTGSGGSGDGGTTPQGKGVVASKAVAYQPPKPAVAPVGASAPKVGTCLADTYVDSANQRLGLGTTAPCDGPHVGQVFAVVGLPPDKVATFYEDGKPLTGGLISSYRTAQAQVTAESTMACQPSFDALRASVLALGTGDDAEHRVWGLEDRVRFPDPTQWDAGDRWAACVVEAPEDAPITGVPDVTVAVADKPMPIGLQKCGNVTGRRVPCDGDIVQIQEFLEIPIEIPTDEAKGGVATAAERKRATERCREALAEYAPELAESGQVQAYDTQVMEQDTRRDRTFGSVGRPLSTCSVAPNAAKGLGLPSLVP